VPWYKSREERAVLELLWLWLAEDDEDEGSSWCGRMLEWSVRPDRPREVWLRRSSDLELRSLQKKKGGRKPYEGCKVHSDRSRKLGGNGGNDHVEVSVY